MHKIDYIVLQIQEEGQAFLKGITSNTLDTPQNAFLDRHGKIVTTFFQKKIDSKTILLVLPRSAFSRVMTHLMPYLKVAQAVVEKKKWYVYISNLDQGDYHIALGQWNVLVAKNEIEETMDEDSFSEFRVTHNIPLQDIDYTNEMVLNVSSDFVSFDKGCYLGQEVVTRISHRAKVPKKLVVVDSSSVTEEERNRMTSVYKGRGFLFVRNE